MTDLIAQLMDKHQAEEKHKSDLGSGGVLPYMGYIAMCGPKRYGFSAVLVINRISIIAILPPLW